MSVTVLFVVPNRDDPEQPPTLYEYWSVQAVPRVGESVEIEGKPWCVKWVSHILQISDDSKPKNDIHVRLIEPDHWTQL